VVTITLDVIENILRDAAVAQLLDRLQADPQGAVTAAGPGGSAAPLLAAAASKHLKRPILYIAAHLEEADRAADDLQTFTERDVSILTAFDGRYGEGAAAIEIAAERARVCARLLANDTPNPIVVAPIQALMQAVPTPKALEAATRALHVGQSVDPDHLAGWLVDRQFERVDQVEEAGHFAMRGGILDIYSPGIDSPVRIEFFGDVIESIRTFDLGTQRSVDSLKRIEISALPGGAVDGQTCPFFRYLHKNTLVILSEPLESIELGRLVLERLDDHTGLDSPEAVIRQSAAFGQLHIQRFGAGIVGPTLHMRVNLLSSFSRATGEAIDDLAKMTHETHVIVYCDSPGEVDRMNELLRQHTTDKQTRRQGEREQQQETTDGEQQPGEGPDSEDAGERAKGFVPGNMQVLLGLVHRGFLWPGANLAVVPHHEIFGRAEPRRLLRRVPAARPIESFLDLSPGDYVVHVQYGIARFENLQTLKQDDRAEEYLTLKFAGNATLHVPASQIHLVQKYVGSSGIKPHLSHLGGTRWKQTKEKVVAAIEELAREMLRVQALRQARPGIAYPGDTEWQRQFEEAFPYQATEDQVRIAGEIKQDMQKPKPMDRLVCGDVGYGKTEIAMRGSFKCIEFGKQVAVLAPTTILAEQHMRSFRERMAGYPFVVECLSRFRTDSEQRDIVLRAMKGEVDVLIGTHRILSKDVFFKDLGLVIIDEEQRFGVEQKERLKLLRETVDVLTMTATPIPRTLHMGLLGLRDISTLMTAPVDRRAVQTQVLEPDPQQIRHAILRELGRDGQVYFVHNRVKSIQAVASKIGRLVPDARIGVGHGQMEEGELEEVIYQFITRQIDILVSTAIIENGVDQPTANTMFIDQADMFGLADLHQLRGRIGRYKHRAYCYLLLPTNRDVTPTARRRLQAIEQYSELGAGFHIAMRDLEIRGAGNLLGGEQSGHIAAVGYELYCQLLEEAVHAMKNLPIERATPAHLELNISAYIPSSYISASRQRMEIYRRISACRNEADVEHLRHDVTDAFGKPPRMFDRLLLLAENRLLAGKWQIESMILHKPDIVIAPTDMRLAEKVFQGAPGLVRLVDGTRIYWRLPENYLEPDTLLVILRRILLRAGQQAIVPSEKEQPVRK
jgi:transcription-repair coupling factor (superfamily II helicase)